MQIPPHLFEAASAALRASRPGPDTKPGSERRSETRTPVLSVAKMIPCTGRLRRAPVNIEVHDLSEHGIGIVMKAPPLHATERFILPLLGTPGCGWKAALFEVTHWRPMPDEMCSVGARFVQEVKRPTRSSAATNPVSPSEAAGQGLDVPHVAAALTARGSTDLTEEERDQVNQLEARLRQFVA